MNISCRTSTFCFNMIMAYITGFRLDPYLANLYILWCLLTKYPFIIIQHKFVMNFIACYMPKFRVNINVLSSSLNLLTCLFCSKMFTEECVVFYVQNIKMYISRRGVRLFTCITFHVEKRICNLFYSSTFWIKLFESKFNQSISYMQCTLTSASISFIVTRFWKKIS